MYFYSTFVQHIA